jgi:hypothetical protein
LAQDRTAAHPAPPRSGPNVKEDGVAERGTSVDSTQGLRASLLPRCLSARHVAVLVLFAVGLSDGAAFGQDLDWATRAGGTGFTFTFSYGIAVDEAGNSYVTGQFADVATFGAGEANETTLTSLGGADIFVAKYTSTGMLLWAKRAGGPNPGDLSLAIAVDGFGNSYVTGQYDLTATFGPGEANETTLQGQRHLFIAKYDAAGLLLWARQASGFSSSTGHGIAVDNSGNSYVTGWFTSFTTFGPGETNEITLIGAGGQDIFVAKYDADGQLLWVRSAGGSQPLDHGLAIALDELGNSYVTGQFGFDGTDATFGAGEINETTLSCAGLLDLFVAKYDTDGALQWARSAGGLAADRGTSIDVDGSGNSYVTGYFGGPGVIFGPGEDNETILNGMAHDDIFVAKYDPDGSLLWVSEAFGPGSADWGQGIAVDAAGNSYVTGHIEHVTTFGAGEANQTVLIPAGGLDVFVAMYDPDGALVWARRAGSGGFFGDRGQGIALDQSGGAYVTGFFSATATFGPGEANETVLTSAGIFDAFVARYAAAAPENQPPVAVDDAATVGEGQTVVIDVLANDFDPDGDPLAIVSATQGELGTVQIAPDGQSLTYTAGVLGTLIDRVDALPLNAGLINSLRVKVQAAQASFARGNAQTGANQLRALINQLEALVRSGQLDPDLAGVIIAIAQLIELGSVTDMFQYTIADPGGLTASATVVVTITFW